MKLDLVALSCVALMLSACTKKDSRPATHVVISMRKFAIEPNAVRVKRGENVTLDISTRDVQHGFGVRQLGINEPIQPGRDTQIALDTSKTGEFKVECTIICGAKHDDMTAKIVVEP